MPIDRDDCEERQLRLDWMIDEFRKAQTQRLMKANDRADSQNRPIPSASPWSHTTIDATDTRNLPAVDRDSR